MKNLRIVFYGTPDFAATVLQTIIQSKHGVVAVVTAPDRPAGRGQKVRQSAVKKTALEHGLPVLQPTNLKSKDFIHQLEEYHPEVQVIVAFRMLPRVVWKLPKYGTFNLHASLLPAYRGAAPINWAVVNREKVSGVTTFFIDDKIDTGEIILQKEVVLDQEENAGSLHDKLMYAGADLTLESLDLIAKGNVSTKPQKDRNAPADAPKLNNENTKIFWDMAAADVHAFVRGMNPYPIAKAVLHTNDEKKGVKIFNTSISNDPVNDLKAGSIVIKDRKFYVATSDFLLQIEKLQLPGKKPVTASDLLNGHVLTGDARFLNSAS